MLVEVTKESIMQYREQLYALSRDPAKTSYPLFCGVNAKEDFFAHLDSCAEDASYTSLFYREGDEVLGLIQYFAIPQERYLQLCGCHIARHTQDALAELLAHLAQYDGFSLYFGFPAQNEQAGAFLRAHGFSLIEDSCHDVLLFSEYEPQPCGAAVRKIDAAHFADFARLHRTDENTYWTGERIRETFDRWNLYALYENGAAAAAIYETGGEIYGMDFAGGVYRKDAFKALVRRVLNERKAAGAREMTFFNEDETQEAVTELGFRFVGRYHLYHTVLGGMPE